MIDDVPAVEVVKREPVITMRGMVQLLAIAACVLLAESCVLAVAFVRYLPPWCNWLGVILTPATVFATGRLMAAAARKRPEWRMSFGQIRDRERLAKRG